MNSENQSVKSENPTKIKTNKKQGAIIGGYICFVLGILVMFVSLFYFIIYIPLFLATFILGIVAMSKKQILGGSSLLLVATIVPLVLGYILVLTRTVKFVEEGGLNNLQAEVRAENIDSSKSNPIKGSFGMNLGDKFDIKSAIAKDKSIDGRIMYQFKPSKQFRSFSKYFVFISPKTNKIYAIQAVASIESRAKTAKERAMVVVKEKALVFELLKKRYGSGQNKHGYGQEMFVPRHGTQSINIGARNITLESSFGFMRITCIDNTLMKLAKKERKSLISSKAKQTDSSGL